MIPPQTWTPKCAQFLAALAALCREHRVTLRPSADAFLQVWDQDAHQPSGLDWESVRDCTTPTAGHEPPRRPLTLLDLEQAGKVVVRD